MGTPGEPGAPENEAKAREAIETVGKKIGTPDIHSQLRAKALKAELDRDFSTSSVFWQAILADNPRDAQALFGLGVANQMLANAAQDNNLAEARRLWGAAGDFYRQALKIKRDYHEAANNWGIALAPTDLPAARVRWQTAGERYRQALEIKRDYHVAPYNWSNALIHEFHALLKDDPEAAKNLLDQASLHFRQAEDIKSGVGAYNLACIAALKRDVQGCVEWLNIASLHGRLPGAEHLRAAPDLAWVREQPEFRAWWIAAFGEDGAGAP